MSAKTFRLRVDLAGAMSNAIDALNGEKGWTHPFRDPPGEEDRDSSVAMLEMIRDHIRDLRAGKVALDDFCDFYLLAPEQSAAGHPVAVDGGKSARERAEGDAEPLNTSNIKDQTHG